MPKIIQPGDPDVVSFNDDSSPDSRLTSKSKISVNAQVIPEQSPDWFYRVLQLCESIPGELKSADVWTRFQSLDNEAKRQIWVGLSRVRIHIVDPRPYRKSFENVLRRIFRTDDADTVLREQVALKEPRATVIWKHLQSGIAESMLSDSCAQRVLFMSQFLKESSKVIDSDQDLTDDRAVTVADFGADPKPLVRNVTMWAAKSAATFHEALDSFYDFDETLRYFPNRIIRQRMKERVLRTHAFDQGNDRQIELLKVARDEIDAALADYKPPELSIMGAAETSAEPYPMLCSHNSYHVQAADIAAGIASKLIEIEGLAAVVSNFEYVTYNGERVSVADIEDEIKRLGS